MNPSFPQFSHRTADSDLSARAFGAPGSKLSLDVIVTRGALVESRHRVNAAVVDADGRLLHAARDPHRVTWWRSCAKPFQVLPLLESGGFDELGWGVDHLALACASHGGEPEHVAIASAMLSSVGLEEGDLACGPHEPLSTRGGRVLRESGHRTTRLHNNCSGKHAAMLARARLERWPTAGYQNADHPVQVSSLATVAKWAGLQADAVPVAIDGCGVTVFALSLAHMALSYARLTRAALDGEVMPRRIISAMTGNPFLVGGSDRFDTVLMEAYEGRVLCKIGAEGVHTLGLVERGIGMALKVEDGTQRAQYPAVIALLAHLGEHPAVGTPASESLHEHASRAIRNTRNEVVGEIRIGDTALGDVA